MAPLRGSRGSFKLQGLRYTASSMTLYIPYLCSTGYGASLAFQSVLALASGRAAAADPLGRLHLAAVAGYGLRLASFVLWRDSLPSFQRRKAESDAKLAGMPLSKVCAGGKPLFRGAWCAAGSSWH